MTLIALLLGILAAAQPAWKAVDGQRGRVTVIVDRGATMSAVIAGRSRLARLAETVGPVLLEKFGPGEIEVIDAIDGSASVSTRAEWSKQAFAWMEEKVPGIIKQPHAISLSWTDNSGSETGFILERSGDNGSTWTQLGGDIHASGYVDDTADPNKTYKYRAKSFIDDIIRGETAWSSTVTATTSGLGDGLTATYFDNMDFSGTSVARIDQAVNFHWDTNQAPVSGIAANSFGVEWKGQVKAPASGSYTFSTLSDDGVRLWVNDTLVINNWSVHSPATDTGTITLSSGTKYNIRMEYFQNSASADAHLSWVVPGGGTAAASIPTANLYSAYGTLPAAPDEPEDVTASMPGTEVTTPAQALASIHWSDVSGASLYQILRSSDGGATFTYVGSIVAGAADHFTDNTLPPNPTGSYRYRVVAIGAGGRSAVVEALDGPGAVVATANGDSIRLSWSDQTADGGTRWVIERSDDNGAWHYLATTNAGDLSFDDNAEILDGHSYRYRLTEYVDIIASAPALSAAVIGGDAPAAPSGVSATYFANTNLTGAQWTPSELSALSFNFGNSKVGPGALPSNAFSARFNGQITAPQTGNYIFKTSADGGVRLWVNGRRIINRWADVARLQGDANEDRHVGFEDLVALAQNYDRTSPPPTWADGVTLMATAPSAFRTWLLCPSITTPTVPMRSIPPSPSPLRRARHTTSAWSISTNTATPPWRLPGLCPAEPPRKFRRMRLRPSTLRRPPPNLPPKLPPIPKSTSPGTTTAPTKTHLPFAVPMMVATHGLMSATPAPMPMAMSPTISGASTPTRIIYSP